MELKRIEQDFNRIRVPGYRHFDLTTDSWFRGIRADHFLLMFIEACDDAESRVTIADHNFGCGVPL